LTYCWKFILCPLIFQQRPNTNGEKLLRQKTSRENRETPRILSLVPKHKGTENLRAQVKRKIAILRKEMPRRNARKLE